MICDGGAHPVPERVATNEPGPRPTTANPVQRRADAAEHRRPDPQGEQRAPRGDGRQPALAEGVQSECRQARRRSLRHCPRAGTGALLVANQRPEILALLLRADCVVEVDELEAGSGEPKAEIDVESAR